MEMQKGTRGEKYHVIDWTIKNFSCWSKQIHENVILSPKSQNILQFIVELYPRSLNGIDEHLVVYLSCEYPSPIFGEVSLIGSDGSLLYKRQVDYKGQNKIVPLPPGPKYEEVIAQIRKNEAIHGDRLILRYRIRSECDTIEHLHTKIDAFEVSLKIYPDIFKSIDIESTHHAISLLKFPLREKEIKPFELNISKDPIGQSKIVLKLNPVDYEKKLSVFTRMSVLNNEDVVRTEENKHLFQNYVSWDFCSSLTFEEVKKRGFSLILYFKIIPRSCKHSFGLYRYRPFKMDIMPTDSISRPLETVISEKHGSKILPTVTSHKPESSLTVLSEELMCLYQDQDFSDFQLKCGDVSFPVHRNILSARSSVFKTMLSTDMRESVSGCMDIVDLNPSTLGLFLAYLYTGGTVEKLQGESALKLYYAADKYQVPSLKKECVNFLCDNVSISNAGDILSLANRHQDDKLISVANEFILNNFNEVLASAEWKSFMRSEPLLAVETLTHFGEKKYVRKS